MKNLLLLMVLSTATATLSAPPKKHNPLEKLFAKKDKAAKQNKTEPVKLKENIEQPAQNSLTEKDKLIAEEREQSDNTKRKDCNDLIQNQNLERENLIRQESCN